MAKTIKRLGEIRDNVEANGINVEKYVKELAVVTMDLTEACGSKFKQEHFRFIAMFLTTRNNGGRGGGGFYRDVMEYKGIMNLRAVHGDKSRSTMAPEIHHSPWTSWSCT